MSSQQLIANKLLAFIQHAIDTIDESSIVKICKSSFKEDEICSGKALLYRSVGKADQMPSRRRDGGEKSLQDIISLMKEIDPDDVPTFVAKELHKLPPVTSDHVDVSRLLKDMNTLKTSLDEVKCKLEASDNTISDLRAQVALLSNAASVSRSPAACNVNTCRGAQNASLSSLKFAVDHASPAAVAACAAPRPAARPSAPAETSRVCTATPARPYSAVTAATKRSAAAPLPERQSTKGINMSRVSGPVAPSEPQSQMKKCDADGFTRVEKRRRKPTNKNLRGTAPTGCNHLLRPAAPTTLLYLSRLHYSTKSEEIVEYIRVKTKFTLRVERLESRHNVNFNSFVLRVPTEHLSTFMKEEFWPKGVMYRRFRGRLPDTRLRHTSPAESIRVK